ncbi:GNAT family N-acetyltransferase [Desulfovibrio sulfodismutans]|uniref:GNAT family N-acetyltransferase n=1 Tax=Desulfolutivibrio sulfodismutans TaxID=63561 RepID=A0A7K3NK06_9BACT|nr:GNAT family N-acetyltransferase [Desulfolutivibrio sulfodismutans]NDY56534.1 GNAT family N-acetyltransferase [Desulfolutivibrio sulfodismutans]QLA12623.1 GNAT family N-acetyltransferase [Desulfolutivibrio sulfodismutans DSM 3696]
MSIFSCTNVCVELTDMRSDLEGALSQWKHLCDKSDTSYYISHGWIATWCTSLEQTQQLYLMRVLKDDECVYACVVTTSKKMRQGIVPTRLVSVYSCGDIYLDSICGIYNHFLKLKEVGISIRDVVNSFPFGWDEFYFPGASTRDFPGNGFYEYDDKYIIYDYDKPAYTVDLTKVGKTFDSFLSTLSQNTRSQIKRSMRAYKEFGELQVHEADSRASAREMLEEMYYLGRLRKDAQGIVSSLNPYVIKFNDNLLESRFSFHEIQVLKITAGDKIIGYLYNHVYNGTVYFYQCGFHYSEDNKMRPGLVAHTLAIVYNANKNHMVYDFGAGEDRYKKSLSNGKSNLVWVRLLKPTLKMKMFKTLKTFKEQSRVLLGGFFSRTLGKDRASPGRRKWSFGPARGAGAGRMPAGSEADGGLAGLSPRPDL